MPINMLELLHDSGALMDGHFLLTSGRHSDRYIEKFRLLEQPRHLDQAAEAMVAGIEANEVDVVLGAAVGGILIAGAVARILNKRTMFTERVDGQMTLRRGFTLAPADRVLVVEDIVSTGGSVRELLAVVQQSGAGVAGVRCLVDRTLEGIDFGLPAQVLLRLKIDNWEPRDCPLCRDGIPLEKPGSTGKAR